MKISALEEYGLRCLLQLAKAPDNQLISADEIALKEGLSTAYVEKILSQLRRSHLVKSVRGTKGGYKLIRKPNQISIGDYIRVVDGNFFAEMCQHFPGKETECTHTGHCSIRPVWLMVARQVYRVLDRLTLADLLVEEATLERQLVNEFPMQETVVALTKERNYCF